MLWVAESFEKEVVNAKAGALKVRSKGILSLFCQQWGSEIRNAGHKGDMGERSICLDFSHQVRVFM